MPEAAPQLACPRCQSVVAEPVAPALIDRGQAAPGLLAQVAIQKYADHLPLYRQEAIFARHGITLARSTLAEWLGHVGLRLQPLVDALRARLLTAPVLRPMKRRSPSSTRAPARPSVPTCLFGHGWPPDASEEGAAASPRHDPPPIVIFDYCRTRAGRHAVDVLGAWQGALMVDDYGGYKALFAQGITELGCRAHARRKFFDAHKASGSPVAAEALKRIGEPYAIEATLRDLNPQACGRERQRRLVPKLAVLKRWLDELQPKVLGNTGLDKAVNYAVKRWNALARVADDGRYPIDNNPIPSARSPSAARTGSSPAPKLPADAPPPS